MKISLVMSTLGRIEEVLEFIAQLERVDHDDLELIIVDQNSTEALFEACSAVRTRFPLQYIRSPEVRGLSRGRNMGALRASGDILCFPDDDCLYPSALLANVVARFAQSGADIVCGRAAAPDGRPINGRFERMAQPVDLKNVFTTQIEWVVFFRREVFEKLGGYDEDVGVGASTPWQACEGPDITIRAIKAGFSAYYDPALFAHHPELNTHSPNSAMRTKGRGYARGMGHVIRKHRYGFMYLFNYLVRPIGGACLSILKGNLNRSLYYLNVFAGRVEGYAGVCFGVQKARK